MKLLFKIGLLSGAVAVALSGCGSDGDGSKGSGGTGGAKDPDDEMGSGASSMGGADDGGSSGTGGRNRGGSSGVGGSSNSGGTLGGGGLGGSGSDEGISLDEFCEPLHEQMCQWLLDARAGFTGDCEAWWGTHNVEEICTAAKALVDEGRLIFDGVKAEECLDLSSGVQYPGIPPVASLRGIPSFNPCDGVFTGTAAIGDDCRPLNSLDECAQGYCAPNVTCPGQCVPFAQVDESCGDGVLCASGLVCSEEQCVALPGEGEECAASSCAVGLTCLATQDANLCVQLAEVGDACEHPEGCLDFAACDAGVCTESVELGGACRSTEHCPAGAACENDGTGGNFCVVAPGDGEACAGSLCAKGFGCLDNVCRPLVGEGDDCTLAVCSDGSSCRDGTTCSFASVLGDACTAMSTSECGAGVKCLPQPSPSVQWSCELPGPLGAGCNPGQQMGCAEGFCSPTTEECSPASDVGGECVANAASSCIPGTYCLESVCVPSLEEGEICQQDRECESRSCGPDGTCIASCTN